MSTINDNLGQRLQYILLTFMPITPLQVAAQAVYALLQSYVSAQVVEVLSLVVLQQLSVVPLLYPGRLEYQHQLEARRIFIPLDSDLSDDDSVGHNCYVFTTYDRGRVYIVRTVFSVTLRFISFTQTCSPGFKGLRSTTQWRLSNAFFWRCVFSHCPSLHLGNVTTVDPAMLARPERLFEAFAPSVAQLDFSRCSRELTCTREVFHSGTRFLQETLDCFHSSLRNSIWLRVSWTACSVSESMIISKFSERWWRVLRTIVCGDNFWNSMTCKYRFQIVHDRGWISVVQYGNLDKFWRVVNNK